MTGITDVQNGSPNKFYVYDKLGRLAEVRGCSNAYSNRDWKQVYSYDGYGNRTGVTKTD